MENHKSEVTVGLGATLNKGDFNSLRIDIRVTDQARNKANGQPETIDETFRRVYDFVEKKLEEKIEEESRGE